MKILQKNEPISLRDCQESNEYEIYALYSPYHLKRAIQSKIDFFKENIKQIK